MLDARSATRPSAHQPAARPAPTSSSVSCCNGAIHVTFPTVTPLSAGCCTTARAGHQNTVAPLVAASESSCVSASPRSMIERAATTLSPSNRAVAAIGSSRAACTMAAPRGASVSGASESGSSAIESGIMPRIDSVTASMLCVASRDASTTCNRMAPLASESRTRTSRPKAALSDEMCDADTAALWPTIAATVSYAMTASVAAMVDSARCCTSIGSARSSNNTVRTGTRDPVNTGCATPADNNARVSRRSSIHHRSVGMRCTVVASSIPVGRNRAVASASARGRCRDSRCAATTPSNPSAPAPSAHGASHVTRPFRCRRRAPVI